jgi:uncharacterized membrane protein YgcG
MFVAAGLHERPAAVIVVAPKQRRIEIVTGPELRGRISDEDAANAVAMMSASLARGELALGLVAAVEQLAASASTGTRVPAPGLANVLDG